MRIKKQNKNEYVSAEGIWVRNPCSTNESLDVNKTCENDLKTFLYNESSNIKISGMQLDDLKRLNLENVIICSDGYKWKDKQKVLGDISNKKVKVIGVNGSLAKWEMVGDKSDIKRTMSLYLANNPYKECMSYLPESHDYYPNLIASTRTSPEFLERYKGQPYFYKPTRNSIYSGINFDQNHIFLDDYRNPICAAISLAWLGGVKKLALLCCDESFEDERPSAIKMENGLYQYPQQIMCQKIIDKQFYWLKKTGIELFDCSSGIEYENAAYIKSEKLKSFFEGIE